MHVWAGGAPPTDLLKNDSISRSNVNTCAVTSLAVFLRGEKIFNVSPKQSEQKLRLCLS